MSRPGTSHAAALDPYLAGLVAYATMVGLVGRPFWRNALWVAVGVYAIVHVGALHTPVLALLITVLAGRAIGLAVRYVAGSTSQRPGAQEIAAALAAAEPAGNRDPAGPPPGKRGHRVPPLRGDDAGTATRLDVVVYDRDQQAAGAVYRLYRSVRVLGQVSRNAPLSVERDGRAPGAAVLRGGGCGRAHAAAARPGPGRSRGRRARLRAPRRDDAGEAESRLQRRRTQSDMGRGRPAARPPGHAPRR